MWARLVGVGRRRGGRADVQVPVQDHDRLARPADQPLDVVGRVQRRRRHRVGALEHHHVPPLGAAEQVAVLQHQDSVAVVDGGPVGPPVGRAGLGDAVPAVGAVNWYPDLPAGGRDGQVVAGLAGRVVDREVVPAVGAPHLHVRPEQRRGHRPGRDHERLDDERPEHERQDERDQDRLDGVLDVPLGVGPIDGGGRGPPGRRGRRGNGRQGLGGGGGSVHGHRVVKSTRLGRIRTGLGNACGKAQNNRRRTADGPSDRQPGSSLSPRERAEPGRAFAAAVRLSRRRLKRTRQLARRRMTGPAARPPG